MPDRSPALALPYLMPSQAQKHVTHNEALQRLDALVQLCVQGFDQTLPPAQPEEGHAYALGSNPTGIWAAEGDRIAVYQNASWSFFTPQVGWRAFGHNEGALRIWTGSAWQPPVPEIDNVDRVGIGTSADAVNRLAVAAEATLLSHDGAGGHQLKINKATSGDTASLLYQAGWSGRAEIGLTGSDDLAFKVSQNGNTWHTGLRISGATGAVDTDQDLRVGGALTADGPINVKTSDSDPTGNNVEGLRIQPDGQIRGSNTGLPPMVLNRIEGTGTILSLKAGGVFVGSLRADANQISLTSPNDLTLNAGGSEAIRLDAVGHVGIGMSAPAVPLHIKDLMRLEPAAPPATPSAGDIYFDNSTMKLRCHDGSAWHDLF